MLQGRRGNIPGGQAGADPVALMASGSAFTRLSQLCLQEA